MGEILVLGSFVVDLMARGKHLPGAGETVKGSFFAQGAGGKGFNQAMAAHKSGGNVKIVTKLGHDAFADVAKIAMERVGASDEWILYSEDTATGIALILVDDTSGQNSIMVVPGACGTFTDEDFERVKPLILKSDYLLLQLEINQEMNEKAARLAKKSGKKVIVNTAPYMPLSDEFLNGIYLVTPNEIEAQEMTGIEITDSQSADKASEIIFKKGVQNVIITLGSRGAYVNDGRQSKIVPPFRVKAIDTTGAGDAFNGGLLTALASGDDLFSASWFANAVAALSVQKYGTTPSLPTEEEIYNFIKEYPKGTI